MNYLGGTALPGNRLFRLIRHESRFIRHCPTCTCNGCQTKRTVPQHPGCGQQIFLRGMCDPETKDVLFGHANQWQHTTPEYSHLHTRWGSCVLCNKKPSCTNTFHYHLQQAVHSTCSNFFIYHRSGRKVTKHILNQIIN